mgnify:FL=1
MRRFFSSVCLVLLVIACGSLPQEQEAESAVGITAPDGYSVTCASSYTRAAPHLCLLANTPTETTPTFTYGVCKTWSLSTIPSSSKSVIVQLGLDVQSANVINNAREINITYYANAGCGLATSTSSLMAYEFVALAARSIATNKVQVVVPTVAGTAYFIANQVSCPTCSATMQIQ